VCPNLFGGRTGSRCPTARRRVRLHPDVQPLHGHRQPTQTTTRHLLPRLRVRPAKARPGDYMSELVAWTPSSSRRSGAARRSCRSWAAPVHGGRLVFHGKRLRIFKALDAWTGKVLWHSTRARHHGRAGHYEVDAPSTSPSSPAGSDAPSFLGWIGREGLRREPGGRRPLSSSSSSSPRRGRATGGGGSSSAPPPAPPPRAAAETAGRNSSATP